MTRKYFKDITILPTFSLLSRDPSNIRSVLKANATVIIENNMFDTIEIGKVVMEKMKR